jgi:hypothetical protein
LLVVKPADVVPVNLTFGTTTSNCDGGSAVCVSKEIKRLASSYCHLEELTMDSEYIPDSEGSFALPVKVAVGLVRLPENE